MRTIQQFTALIEREGNQYVALCPELDIASQGDTVEQARKNLHEALRTIFLKLLQKKEINLKYQLTSLRTNL